MTSNPLLDRAVASLSGVLSEDVDPAFKRAIAEAVVKAVNPVPAVKRLRLDSPASDIGQGINVGADMLHALLVKEGWPDAGSGEGD